MVRNSQFPRSPKHRPSHPRPTAPRPAPRAAPAQTSRGEVLSSSDSDDEYVPAPKRRKTNLKPSSRPAPTAASGAASQAILARVSRGEVSSSSESEDEYVPAPKRRKTNLRPLSRPAPTAAPSAAPRPTRARISRGEVSSSSESDDEPEPEPKRRKIDMTSSLRKVTSDGQHKDEPQESGANIDSSGSEYNSSDTDYSSWKAEYIPEARRKRGGRLDREPGDRPAQRTTHEVKPRYGFHVSKAPARSSRQSPGRLGNQLKKVMPSSSSSDDESEAVYDDPSPTGDESATNYIVEHQEAEKVPTFRPRKPEQSATDDGSNDIPESETKTTGLQTSAVISRDLVQEDAPGTIRDRMSAAMRTAQRASHVQPSVAPEVAFDSFGSSVRDRKTATSVRPFNMPLKDLHELAQENAARQAARRQPQSGEELRQLFRLSLTEPESSPEEVILADARIKLQATRNVVYGIELKFWMERLRAAVARAEEHPAAVIASCEARHRALVTDLAVMIERHQNFFLPT
ncbi:hypothetical protein BDW02DRAFT_603236 [Decorospora gaudefroyi]|uniref:Uncharacterized protein n=1 Tax=Decorospora gaudefroyi TaxID=184978 RepID=A0A6A5JXC6_9PLEO|nr:hypothetical protein BDW02DRAFT_603236 [Decorospora gaudefroyi]